MAVKRAVIVVAAVLSATASQGRPLDRIRERRAGCQAHCVPAHCLPQYAAPVAAPACDPACMPPGEDPASCPDPALLEGAHSGPLHELGQELGESYLVEATDTFKELLSKLPGRPFHTAEKPAGLEDKRNAVVFVIELNDKKAYLRYAPRITKGNEELQTEALVLHLPGPPPKNYGIQRQDGLLAAFPAEEDPETGWKGSEFSLAGVKADLRLNRDLQPLPTVVAASINPFSPAKRPAIGLIEEARLPPPPGGTAIHSQPPLNLAGTRGPRYEIQGAKLLFHDPKTGPQQVGHVSHFPVQGTSGPAFQVLVKGPKGQEDIYSLDGKYLGNFRDLGKQYNHVWLRPVEIPVAGEPGRLARKDVPLILLGGDYAVDQHGQRYQHVYKSGSNRGVWVPLPTPGHPAAKSPGAPLLPLSAPAAAKPPPANPPVLTMPQPTRPGEPVPVGQSPSKTPQAVWGELDALAVKPDGRAELVRHIRDFGPIRDKRREDELVDAILAFAYEPSANAGSRIGLNEAPVLDLLAELMASDRARVRLAAIRAVTKHPYLYGDQMVGALYSAYWRAGREEREAIADALRHMRGLGWMAKDKEAGDSRYMFAASVLAFDRLLRTRKVEDALALFQGHTLPLEHAMHRLQRGALGRPLHPDDPDSDFADALALLVAHKDKPSLQVWAAWALATHPQLYHHNTVVMKALKGAFDGTTDPGVKLAVQRAVQAMYAHRTSFPNRYPPGEGRLPDDDAQSPVKDFQQRWADGRSIVDAPPFFLPAPGGVDMDLHKTWSLDLDKSIEAIGKIPAERVREKELLTAAWFLRPKPSWRPIVSISPSRKKGIEVLVKLAGYDGLPNVQVAAIEALGAEPDTYHHGDVVVDALYDVYKKTKDPKVRAAVKDAFRAMLAAKVDLPGFPGRLAEADADPKSGWHGRWKKAREIAAED